MNVIIIYKEEDFAVIPQTYSLFVGKINKQNRIKMETKNVQVISTVCSNRNGTKVNDVFADGNKERLKMTIHRLFTSAMKKLIENDKCYNEEGDEEEEYGFKKAFFYNNENFWG